MRGINIVLVSPSGINPIKQEITKSFLSFPDPFKFSAHSMNFCKFVNIHINERVVLICAFVFGTVCCLWAVMQTYR